MQIMSKLQPCGGGRVQVNDPVPARFGIPTMNNKRSALKSDILPSGTLSFGGSQSYEQTQDDPSQCAGACGGLCEEQSGLIDAEDVRRSALAS